MGVILTNLVLGNMIWPALYVSEKYLMFWYLIFFTIAVEGLILYKMIDENFGKVMLGVTIGNIVSALCGIFAMPVFMLLYHAIFDFIFSGTFNLFNWVATYLIMCFGSVLIETLVVKKLLDQPFGKLFKVLLIGNFLTYLVTALVDPKV